MTPDQRKLSKQHPEAFEAGCDVERARCQAHLELAVASSGTGFKALRPIEQGHDVASWLSRYSADAAERGCQSDFARALQKLELYAPGSTGATRADMDQADAEGNARANGGRDFGDQVAAEFDRQRGKATLLDRFAADLPPARTGPKDNGDLVADAMGLPPARAGGAK